ncbi:MAG TPA: 4-hydroxy-tetrahydrodipicolinate synthase [Gammaproteobacteria bacterium]|nr:4-hydroxy-tetrahydrodipicolinate synthase [Gammaproteobacteria bacterium]
MLQGSFVALVTPMHEDGRIDFESLGRLVEFHVENGTNGIVSVGTTGESSTLGFDEHDEVIRETVRLAAGRLPVVGGTGANNTEEAIRLTRSAQKAGVDACLLVTPYYNKPTQEGLYRHFRKVAEAVDVPQILYNVPGRTACDMQPDTVARLLEIPNIIGLKEAKPDMQRIVDLRRMCGDRLTLFSGDDGTAMEAMLLGAGGDISVTANVAPNPMQRMCAAAIAGDRATAQEINRPLEGLHKALFMESSPIPVKWALYEMGLIPPGIRLPLTPLAEACREPLRQALQAAGVLK